MATAAERVIDGLTTTAMLGGIYNHWQGIQRLSGASSQYFVVSRSYVGGALPPPMFAVVKLGSRDASGGALGSNLDLAGLPDARDGIVATVDQERDPAGGFFDHAGGLLPLLQEFVSAPMPIYAVYPSRKHLSAKVRLFVDFLLERFARSQDWSAA